MAFTTITITAAIERADGQPATGTLTATLSAQLANGTELLDPTPIRGLIASGALTSPAGGAFTLLANDDPATTPTASSYEFALCLDGAPLEAFSAVVPHAASAATIDLSVLMG